MKEIERIKYYVSLIRQKTDFVPEIALVLGSGLNDFADSVETICCIDYKDLPGFPTCSAEGHKGRFVFGKIGEAKVIIMQGRVHYYEGYDMKDIVLPLRVMHLLGANNVIFTNAAGSMNKEFVPGQFMAFSDYISFLVPSPLRGENIEELGERFPDTTGMFDEKLREKLIEIGEKNNIKVNQGVYVQAAGPQFESPAEMKAFRLWGGDAVGMSTACECTAALQMKMKIVAISLLTNYESGLGIPVEPLTHQQVQTMGQKAVEELGILLKQLIIEGKADGLFNL